MTVPGACAWENQALVTFGDWLGSPDEAGAACKALLG